MKTVVIDDEQAGRELLKEMLKRYCPGANVVGDAASVMEGLKVINETQPEILFLDIEMPQKNGFELFNYIPDPSFHVVFVTAYDHYAMRAFDYAALDYILKPIDKDRILKAWNRAKARKKPLKEQLEIVQDRNKELSLDKIVLPSSEELIITGIKDIIYCKATSNYSEVHLNNGNKHLIAKTLLRFEELLSPHGFYRCHRSYLVNLHEITGISNHKPYKLSVTNGHKIDLSTEHRKQILDLLSTL